MNAQLRVEHPFKPLTILHRLLDNLYHALRRLEGNHANVFARWAQMLCCAKHQGTIRVGAHEEPVGTSFKTLIDKLVQIGISHKTQLGKAISVDRKLTHLGSFGGVVGIVGTHLHLIVCRKAHGEAMSAISITTA